MNYSVSLKNAMQLDAEISDANFKSMNFKAEVCPINPIYFTYHLKNQPSNPHSKTADGFPYDKCPPNRT